MDFRAIYSFEAVRVRLELNLFPVTRSLKVLNVQVRNWGMAVRVGRMSHSVVNKALMKLSGNLL